MFKVAVLSLLCSAVALSPQIIDAAVKKAADAIECILKDGIDKGMNRFNG